VSDYRDVNLANVALAETERPENFFAMWEAFDLEQSDATKKEGMLTPRVY